MKKLYVAVSAMSMLFAFSCSKSDRKDVNPEQHAKVAVNFNVADFIQKVNELPSPLGRRTTANMNRDTTLNNVSHIYYLVTDEVTLATKTIHQQKNVDANFGVISDSLNGGGNSIMIVASVAPLTIAQVFHDGNFGYGVVLNNRPDPSGNEPATLTDIFHKSFFLNMDPSGNPIPKNVPVTLNRVVAKLSVQFTGTNINTEDSVLIRVKNEANGFFLLSGDIFTEIGGNTYSQLTKENNNLYSGLIMNTRDPLTVEISYIHRNTKERVTKVIENVRCYKNKVSLLSGEIFNNPNDPRKNFEIKLNDLWDYSGPVTPF